ncbi:MAG: hypothetical protein JSS81_27220 [Acidobacteria bacterium]|nr:hypothetical protein [Acidobacteriota bacterium]
MKNKLGIFTALILSLVIAGSALASVPGVASGKTAVLKAKAGKKLSGKKHKHRRHHHKRKAMTKKTIITSKKNK